MAWTAKMLLKRRAVHFRHVCHTGITSVPADKTIQDTQFSYKFGPSVQKQHESNDRIKWDDDDDEDDIGVMSHVIPSHIFLSLLHEIELGSK
jgi:hypothetical protein